MNESQLKTLAQLRAPLQGTLTIEFLAISNDAQRFGFISAVLQRFTYRRLPRSDKGRSSSNPERLLVSLQQSFGSCESAGVFPQPR